MKINIEGVSIQLGGKMLLDNISFAIHKGEQWAIAGPSGSGKSMLAKAIAGKVFFRGKIVFFNNEDQAYQPKIILVEQQHHFKNKSNISQFYYQQRFNSADADDTETVLSSINEISTSNNADWIRFFNLEPLLEKSLIQLSNGENKRLQLAKSMMQSPALLVLDNPFIGLDLKGRESLQSALDTLAGQGIAIVLIAALNDLPKSVTHVVLVHGGKLVTATTKPEAMLYEAAKKNQELRGPKNLSIVKNEGATPLFTLAVKMTNVTIAYNGKQILSNINWTVKKGERWCVKGENGSGKSTLLSLINADNPQGYANDIILFDKQRGTGESIWDIKRKIGYVSPELHLFFDQGVTCFEAIASGLFDTIGLFRKPGPTETENINAWIANMELSSIKEKRLNQLSLGEQRLVMLTRALVKSPSLLILDEPCQGLDIDQTTAFKQLIDDICQSTTTTLIYVSHYEHDIPSCITSHLKLDAGMRIEV